LTQINARNYEFLSYWGPIQSRPKMTPSADLASGARGWSREAMQLILPKEHGSWSLALEPLALGLIAAPSVAGGALSASVLAAFFARRPLKVLLGSADARAQTAAWLIAILAAIALAGLLLAGREAGWTRLVPLLAALPPGAAFIWLESRGESRAAGAEVAGALAFAAVPSALASLAGWREAALIALGLAMACRSVPAILTIRAFLRRRKGQDVSIAPPSLANLVALGIILVLVRLQLAPIAAIGVAAALMVRAGLLLGGALDGLSATRVGIGESVLGGLVVLALGLSWVR
jgi:hypothetical protein